VSVTAHLARRAGRPALDRFRVVAIQPVSDLSAWLPVNRDADL